MNPETVYIDARLTQPARSVYIHIPFCQHKCFYCDFNTYAMRGQPVDNYLKALDRELQETVRRFPVEEIDTIFVGGGTPTSLNTEQMEQFLQSVARAFPNRASTFEFTMEANPGTTSLEKLEVMKQGGVNRLSFGAQTFDPQMLKRIGRIHQAEDIIQSVEWARQAGLTNISLDLMYGLPDQTMVMLDDSIDQAFKLELTHYSIYGLKVEENTPFHKWQKQGRLPLPDEDTELAMYERIMERMDQQGYKQYEVSNFARDGYASLHNQVYWRNEPYLGLGAGAHGYVYGKRHVNTKGVQEYIDAAMTHGLPRLEEDVVTRQEAMEDFMMLGMRMLGGIKHTDFINQFGHAPEIAFGQTFLDLIDQGLLEKRTDGYRLTSKGLIYGNEVFGAFLT